MICPLNSKPLCIYSNHSLLGFNTCYYIWIYKHTQYSANYWNCASWCHSRTFSAHQIYSLGTKKASLQISVLDYWNLSHLGIFIMGGHDLLLISYTACWTKCLTWILWIHWSTPGNRKMVIVDGASLSDLSVKVQTLAENILRLVVPSNQQIFQQLHPLS